MQFMAIRVLRFAPDIVIVNAFVVVGLVVRASIVVIGLVAKATYIVIFVLIKGSSAMIFINSLIGLTFIIIK